MINHADIENIIGCKTLVTNRMQRAIEDWYDAASMACRWTRIRKP